MRVCVAYTGCRLNQCECDMIRSRFLSAGYENCRDDADVCVVNTCTVTRQAEVKSVKLIRRLRRENPRARIIAAGCMVDRNRAELEALNMIDSFAPCAEKTGIMPCPEKETDYLPLRTRPFIKIQDGCDFSCSYCAVRLARGPSRSERAEKVLQTVRELSGRGYPEIVLTGVNIGAYRDADTDLAGLLEKILAFREVRMVRLSSIEPATINDRLLSVMADERICRHFHIPLQSGSDRILRLMNRPYTANEYTDLAGRIRAVAKDAVIGTDVIVGFPGETEADFTRTLELLKKNGIFYLHVFRYSPRPGTMAAQLSGSLPEIVKTRRARCLSEYMRSEKKKYFSSLVGKSVRVLVENKVKYGRYISSVSPHYLKVLLPLRPYDAMTGQMAEVTIQKAGEGELYGA